MDLSKVCPRCAQDKPLSEYSTRSDRPHQPKSYCKKCNAEYAKPYGKKRYIEKRALIKATNRKGHYRRTYGMLWDQVLEIWKSQDQKCKICGIEVHPDKRRGFALDHDHKTNKVRGVLCHPCNTGLGAFKDSINNLEKAIQYLNESSSSTVNS